MTEPTQPPSVILGISAKSLHRPNNQRLTDPEKAEAAVSAKTRRFDMLRTAQALLYDGQKSAAQQARVCWCHRAIRTRGEKVGVFRTKGGTSARYGNLSTCGSVWDCPLCGAKITEQRRKELDLAVTAWIKHGCVVNLLTLTFPHEFDMTLADLLARFAKALQSFKNSKTYKRIMGNADRAGSIRSLEATWGENGWHPHTHDLVFLRRALTMHEVDDLKSTWARQCIKAGLGDNSKLSDMLRHGLDIQDGSYAAEYIAKFGHDSVWGASSELTKPHSKTGTVGQFGGADHYTPFQLLAWAHGGDERAAILFREFSAAFKGKRMLSWSPKLRLLLTGCENELSDEELAAHDDPAPDETKAGDLHQDQFAILLSRNKLGDFIGYVARCCGDPATSQRDIDDYVDAISKLPKSHGSIYRKKNFMGAGWSELQ